VFHIEIGPDGFVGIIIILLNKCACFGHFERSEAESRNLVTVHGLVWNTRFLHFGPLRGPPVEMTNVHSVHFVTLEPGLFIAHRPFALVLMPAESL